jgi:hypothetical protein
LQQSAEAQQTPPQHMSPELQVWPQVPQLLRSLFVFVHFPLQQLAGEQHWPPQLTSKREEQHSPFLQFSGTQHWSPHLACPTQYCVTE